MTGSHVFRANSAHDEQSRLTVKAQQVVKPLQCLLIAPLEIIDQQHQRLGSGKHGAGQGLEKPLALPMLGEPFGPREIRYSTSGCAFPS